MVGILNAKRIWKDNQEFWADKGLALEQELIFASTGTKDPADMPWKYVQALSGSDIQTNPPDTNEAVSKSGIVFTRTVDQMLSDNHSARDRRQSRRRSDASISDGRRRRQIRQATAGVTESDRG